MLCHVHLGALVSDGHTRGMGAGGPETRLVSMESCQNLIGLAVIGASFSVTFVIILTMYLLNKQTEIQQESKKGEKVFEEKVSIYKSILSHTREMLKDGKLSREEIIALSFSAIELQMVGADQTISAFNSVFDTANTIYHSDDNEEVIISEQQKMEIYKVEQLLKVINLSLHQ